MPKLAGLLLFTILGGSTQVVSVTVSPYETSITVPADVMEQHQKSPLTRDQWAMRQALRSTPTFAAGTDIELVRAELIEQNLLVLAESPGFMVVREGVPLIDTTGPIREKFVYGFQDGKLNLGPVTFQQVVSHFVTAGLRNDHLLVLQMISEADLSDATNLNDLAWLLATFPDPDLRRPELAVGYAARAVSLGDPVNWMHLDTLAAAHAAHGDFKSAVYEQQRAIDLHYEKDDGAEQRLDLYRSGRNYVSPLTDWLPSETDDEEPDLRPKPQLLADAAAGDQGAQWRLAAFYLENTIYEGEGIINPGLFWMEQAAQNGHPLALNEMGFCYLMASCGNHQDDIVAVRWFERAAAAGDATGAFNYGRMLANGQGTPRDDRVATRWLEIAADNGITAGAFRAAFRHREGVGQPPNPRAYRKYLEQAKSARYGPADYLLDDAFFQQFNGAAAFAAALDRNAIAPSEMADALLVLVSQIESAEASDDALILRFDNGARFSYAGDYGPALVLNLTRIAASLGSRRAQLKYAAFFEDGTIAPRSLPEAHYWRQRAAN
jgi:TPR repeat protein